MLILPNIGNYRRIVIKIGSSLLVDGQDEGQEGQVRKTWLKSLAQDIYQLKQIKDDKTEILIVSSGSIALGRTKLNLHGRALRLDEKQAAAAIGQISLMSLYQESLHAYGLQGAQILLTLQDTELRKRHLNARQAILQLLAWDYIPIINENDTVTTQEIRYGDNDRLAARVASMLSADLLILLSDVDGLYSADPRIDSKAQHIAKVIELNDDMMKMAGGAPAGYSSGGMRTKLAAAHIAMQAGCDMVIAKGAANHPLQRLQNQERTTHFQANSNPLQARKSWIAGMIEVKGKIYIDKGAAKALQDGNSLLPSGVKKTVGDFERGDAVEIILTSDPHNNKEQNEKIATGLIGFSGEETQKIIGLHSNKIAEVLGYEGRSTLIHRDDLVLNS